MTTSDSFPIGTSEHVLDNLVWHALGSTHQGFCRALGAARAYQPDVAVFAALERDTVFAWAQLHQLVGPARSVMLARPEMPVPPAGWTRLGGGFGHQMVLDRLTAVPSPVEAIEALTDEHVPQMLELVELTEPGPFRPRTIQLGHYSGIFIGGRLVAMAGQRMQTPDYTEISAVCTHPMVRGRGLAAVLTHRVASSIVARGQTPVLHVAHSNEGARRVYERLGFAVRRDLEFVAFQTPDGSAEPQPDEVSP
ncbi:MAG: putative acetyltransferase [Ilumatobacteraceae bacterium]|nr:putative acetyltransferase [Ilumatobacteraceae bacterium]